MGVLIVDDLILDKSHAPKRKRGSGTEAESITESTGHPSRHAVTDRESGSDPGCLSQSLSGQIQHAHVREMLTAVPQVPQWEFPPTCKLGTAV